ncbi:MAG: hypothetical protein ACTHUY_10920 [Flaviflexus sp.]|nr:hypothetical protein [Flaviflexus ciconiae]
MLSESALGFTTYRHRHTQAPTAFSSITKPRDGIMLFRIRGSVAI